MIKIGLTGSIGSGKSTVARKAAEELGIPIFDTDKAVHTLYAGDKELQAFLIEKCGPAVVRDGQIDRKILGAFMHAPDKEVWKSIETEVHRRVWQMCGEFFKEQEAAGSKFALVDTPLLFEVGAEHRFDYTVNVNLPYEIQKQRTLARATPKLTEAEFEKRYKAFMSPEDRNKRASFVIDNSGETAASLLQLRLHMSKMRDTSKTCTLSHAFNQAAVYVGSFDPLTLGHIDVVKSASKLPYKKLYVAIGINPAKNPMFTTEERLAMMEREMDRDVRPYLLPGQEIIVTAYEGLTVDFMKSVGASLCIRGLRGITDLDEETALAAANKGLYAEGLEYPAAGEFVQAYLPTSNPKLQHVSSSRAREICMIGGHDLSLLQYVSADVAAKMIAKRDQAKAKTATAKVVAFKKTV
jgi:dephospho-CoA kinase